MLGGSGCGVASRQQMGYLYTPPTFRGSKTFIVQTEEESEHAVNSTTLSTKQEPIFWQPR